MKLVVDGSKLSKADRALSPGLDHAWDDIAWMCAVVIPTPIKDLAHLI